MSIVRDTDVRDGDARQLTQPSRYAIGDSNFQRTAVYTQITILTTGRTGGLVAGQEANSEGTRSLITVCVLLYGESSARTVHAPRTGDPRLRPHTSAERVLLLSPASL